jgi:hypothetical protein
MEYFSLFLGREHDLRVCVYEIRVGGNTTNRTLGSDSGGPSSESACSLCTVVRLNGELHLVTCSRALVNFEVCSTAIVASPNVYNAHIAGSIRKFLSVINLLAVVHYVRLVVVVGRNRLDANNLVIGLAVLNLNDGGLSCDRAVSIAAESVDSACLSTGSFYLLGDGLVTGGLVSFYEGNAASLTELVGVTPSSTCSGSIALGLDEICGVSVLYDGLLAGFTSVGVNTTGELTGVLLLLVTALVGDDSILGIELVDLNIGLVYEDVELMTIVTLVDSVRTVLGAGCVNSCLNESLGLALACYVKDLNSLGVLAILAGEESLARDVLTSFPLGLNSNLGVFPGVLVGLLSVTDRTLEYLLTAYAGNLNPVMGLIPLGGLNFGYLTYATLNVGLTVGLGSAVNSNVLAVLIVGVVNPLMTCSLAAKIVSELLTTLVTLVCSVRRGSTGCCYFAKSCVFTILDSVIFRTTSVIGDSREYGRRYERHYHDCCQNKSKNLFHVFFPFEKYVFWGRHAMLSTRFCASS